jgi:hypothetical protein
LPASLSKSIDTSTLVGLCDRALIGVMTYAFARGGTLKNAQLMAAHESPRTTNRIAI